MLTEPTIKTVWLQLGLPLHVKHDTSAIAIKVGEGGGSGLAGFVDKEKDY